MPRSELTYSKGLKPVSPLNFNIITNVLGDFAFKHGSL